MTVQYMQSTSNDQRLLGIDGGLLFKLSKPSNVKTALRFEKP
jgi:hypothetical protein